jgi:hypothetical protein
VVSVGGHKVTVPVPKGGKAGAWYRQAISTEGTGPAPIQFLPAEGLEVMNVYVREVK